MTANAIKILQTRSGPMLALTTDQYVGRSLELYGEYCPEEGKILRQAIRPGMTVLEIGANMGSHSVDMARACAPGPFYAFEPQPRLFQILCANLALNGIANALAYPDACGEVAGSAIVPWMDYGRPGNFGDMSLRSEGKGLSVNVRPIDGLGLEQCGLIKIDVQGYEAQVLRGARATIMRHRPIIYIENDVASQQQTLISLVAELGYRMYWHTPALFDSGNFRGEQNNIFVGLASLNMFCLPRESGQSVQGAAEIDPTAWTSPFPPVAT